MDTLEIKEKILKIQKLDEQIEKLKYQKEQLENDIEDSFNEISTKENVQLFDDENVKLGYVEKITKKVNSYSLLREHSDIIINALKDKSITVTLNITNTLKLLKANNINAEPYIDATIKKNFVYDVHEGSEEPF